MGNISLALCIPTYERRDMVEDFLINCSAYYIEAGIDIYYYDSSLSDETKELFEMWADGEHIHYIRIPSDVNGSVKGFKVFQGFGLQKEYDFIWLSNDGLQCTKQAIEQITANLKLDYDIIEINSTDSGNIGTRIFTDSNEYMQCCAWHLTLWGAAILNVHTMLEGVDWEYYENKFIVPILAPFSHVSFYFYRILELERFCALHLSLCKRFVKFSKFKKISGWTNNFFFIICECWVQTIEGLPNCYTNKMEAAKTYGDLSTIKRMTTFYRLKECGLYSFRLFLKYWAVWNKVTSFSRKRLFLAAIAPRGLVKMYYNWRKVSGRKKLQQFCRSHKKIYIYGTGALGYIYANYLEKYGLNYEAFCVSHRKALQQEYLSHRVYEFDELKHAKDDIGFVLAMMEYNVEEILPVVQKAVGSGAVFCDLKFSEDIEYELGYMWLL